MLTEAQRFMTGSTFFFKNVELFVSNWIWMMSQFLTGVEAMILMGYPMGHMRFTSFSDTVPRHKDYSDLPAHTLPLCPQCQGSTAFCWEHDGNACRIGCLLHRPQEHGPQQVAKLSAIIWWVDPSCNQQFVAETHWTSIDTDCHGKGKVTILLDLNQNLIAVWSLQCVFAERLSSRYCHVFFYVNWQLLLRDSSATFTPCNLKSLNNPTQIFDTF